MKYAQMIANVTKTIAEKHDAIAELLSSEMEKGTTPNEEKEAQIAQLEAEIETLEKNLTRLNTIQKNAQTVTQTAQAVEAPAIVQANNLPNLEKGIAFAQMVRAKMLSQHEARKNGNFIAPADAAKHLGYSDAIVDYVEKATLGTTADTGFAAPLVDKPIYAQEFIELLRNATVFNRLMGVKNVPFNVKINGQLTGSVADWVGEGAKKPLTNPTYGQIEIKEHKLAGIVVYTQELLRRADPAIDTLVRDDLIAATAELIDKTFLDATAQNDNRPAGILNGATRIASKGTQAAQIEADLLTLLSQFADANLSTDNSYFLMSETRAMQIALLRDALGNSYFNGMNFAGTRSLLGLPVITSQACGDKIILIKASELLVAQDGGVDVSYSDQATLSDGSNTHNLWQENKYAIRVEKYITWTKRRPIACAYIDFAA